MSPLTPGSVPNYLDTFIKPRPQIQCTADACNPANTTMTNNLNSNPRLCNDQKSGRATLIDQHQPPSNSVGLYSSIYKPHIRNQSGSEHAPCEPGSTLSHRWSKLPANPERNPFYQLKR